MTQKELLESVLTELVTIKSGMPNGELKQLADKVEEIKEDVSELKFMLMNPEEGVIVKVNKNTEFRKDKERQSGEYVRYTQDLDDLKRWREGVSKALWTIFSALVGIAIKLIFFNAQ